MSESHDFWWRTTVADNRTLKAEVKGTGQYCIIERKDGAVLRIVYMTADQMRELGRDCLRLVKETGGDLSQER